jgi:hypothetical protein
MLTHAPTHAPVPAGIALDSSCLLVMRAHSSLPQCYCVCVREREIEREKEREEEGGKGRTGLCVCA